MPISRNDVAHAARLAKLELTDAELETFGRELGEITDYVAQLAKVAGTGEPASPVLPLIPDASALREDIVSPSLEVETILGQAPDRSGKTFRVPKVIG